ncbi:MAG: Gfo/Idh/MocA family protein [Terriglobales bacterium]
MPSGSPPRLRVGLAGAGFAAALHAASWRRVAGIQVEITGVYSRSAERREAFAQTHAVPAAVSWEELLAGCDLVDICTPGASHEALAVAALAAGRHGVLEKPYTGHYGEGEPSVDGFTYDRARAMEQVRRSCQRLRHAVERSGRMLGYAENWVYAPVVQKEREILEKSGGQILRQLAEESHSGSHAASYGVWRESGGGALATKGCHPLSAAIYFKQVEGQRRLGQPILPARVSAHAHRLTQLPGYQDHGTLRTDYTDTEDYGQMHVTFSDGTVADIFASDVVLGGVSNWIEVFAGNHRTRCSLNPIDALQTFAPGAETLRDVYVVEKIAPKQGWMRPAPDEDWQQGYHQEAQDFAWAAVEGREPLSGWRLGETVSLTLAAAYLSASQGGRDLEIPAVE